MFIIRRSREPTLECLKQMAWNVSVHRQFKACTCCDFSVVPWVHRTPSCMADSLHVVATTRIQVAFNYVKVTTWQHLCHHCWKACKNLTVLRTLQSSQTESKENTQNKQQEQRKLRTLWIRLEPMPKNLTHFSYSVNRVEKLVSCRITSAFSAKCCSSL